MTGFDNCPSTGSLEYVSDYIYFVVDIYAGKFSGQAPCGQITAGLTFPAGIYINALTHDLYVCNGSSFNGFNILVFRRGQITPYNGYTDPGDNSTGDVVVAPDGTIIASNAFKIGHPGNGSISTWSPSPTGGQFRGNYPMKSDVEGGFITVQKNGTVYFDAIGPYGIDSLWSVSCPAGACGVQTRVFSNVAFGRGLGGIKFDAAGDFVANDTFAQTADTFALPNPKPKTFPLAGVPNGLAIDELDRHWFVADPVNHEAAEYLYPSGVLVGTVTASPVGQMLDIAVDSGPTRR